MLILTYLLTLSYLFLNHMKDNLPLFLRFDIEVWTCDDDDDDDDTWLFKVCILGLFLHISNMQTAFCIFQ